VSRANAAPIDPAAVVTYTAQPTGTNPTTAFDLVKVVRKAGADPASPSDGSFATPKVWGRPEARLDDGPPAGRDGALPAYLGGGGT
jgi:hypothetical protein